MDNLTLIQFGGRLVEVHMSEVNTASRHDPLSRYAVMAFCKVAKWIPENIPIIPESPIDQGRSDVASELQRAREVFSPAAA